MSFAFRERVTEIILAAGQSKRYLLPPTTPGALQLSVHAVFRPGEAEPPDDGTGTPALPFDPGLVESGGAIDRAITGSGEGALPTVARDNQVDTNNPANIVEPDPGSGGGGGGSDSGPSRDVRLELKRIGKTILTTDIGALVYETRTPSSDWNVVIARKADAFPQRRRFRVVVRYWSVLPEEERRVPLAYLRQGFDSLWNQGDSGIQYLRGLWVQGKQVTYYLDRVFAALYELKVEGSIDLPDLGPIDALPSIRTRPPIKALVDVDGTSAPLSGVYFALRIDAFCDGSRALDIPLAPDAELPPEFWIEARFYLAVAGGVLYYEPRIVTNLTIDYFVAEETIRQYLRAKLKGVEGDLRRRQWDDGFRSLFDKHLKPWFLGNYEVTGVRYDPATDDIVLTHVGKPVKKPIVNVVDPDAPTGLGWNMAANPRPARLVKTESEVWATEPPPGQEGGLIRPSTAAGPLAKIDHIVVLMQENRSFDHILGHLSRDLGHTEVDGLLPDPNDRDWNECDRVEYRNEGIRFPSRRIEHTSWPYLLMNPCHGHHCTMRQISDGMKHFVDDFSARAPARDDARRVMDYFGDKVLKVYDELKRRFAICDHWFGSHIGGTLPNRHITFSGDLNRDALGAPEEENSELATYCPSERTTMFDHLSARGVTWHLYEHHYSFLRLYRRYTFDQRNIRAFSEFLEAAERGTLPSVSFIEPDYIELPGGNDDHAPADMREGQRLVARIVKALITSPVWEKTMLIITYDEHGGFYDHLVPPDRIDELRPDGTVETRQIPTIANGIRQLGPRVPAFVVSPFTPGQRPNPDPEIALPVLNVSKRIYEHASIPATILRRFCSPHAPYLSARVDRAHDLGELLSLDAPRPRTEFADLITVLDAAITAPPSADPSLPRRAPLDNLTPGSPDAKEDFHGFLAYAAALTGRR